MLISALNSGVSLSYWRQAPTLVDVSRACCCNTLQSIPAGATKESPAVSLRKIEKRSLSVHQNVIVAHIPPAQEGFYRANGWDVFAEDRGYAWLPFNNVIRADIADHELGFPLMAAKVLRPRAIRIAFDFPIVHRRPVFDASTELNRLIGLGRLDYLDLDENSRSLVDFARNEVAARAR